MKEGVPKALGRILGVVYAVVIITLVSLLVGQVLSAKNNVIYYYSDLRSLTMFEYSINDVKQGVIELPAAIDKLNPGDVVSLQGRIESRMLDNVLIDSEHALFKFYVNNHLYYEIGNPGTYPEFQKEPPHVVTSVALPNSPQYLDLRFDYTVPQNASSLSLAEIYIGDKDLLFTMLVDYNMILLLLSTFLLLGGVILVVIGAIVLRRVVSATAFIWLGLTCLSTALWALCTNTIILYLIQQPSLLYTLGYIGLYGVIPAFLRFNRIVFASKRNWIVRSLSYIASGMFVLILILHLTGIYSFNQMITVMLIFAPILLVIFVIAVLIEQIYYKNPMTFRFIISCSIFAVLAVLEVVNDLVTHNLPSGIFVQIGLAFFVFELAVLAWEYVSKALDASEKNTQLQLEIASTTRALSTQRALYETLVTSNEEMRKLRHDMRHQLSIVRGYLDDNRTKEAARYLDELYGTIPNLAEVFICDNFAINALASHYLALARVHGIQVDLRLVVPEKVGRIADNDLSIIIGNLFENAIEACAYVDEHKRFIKIQSSVDARRFKLIIDNSYDGHLDVRGDDFYSRKRPGKGIGMASVRTEVHKYNGVMKYETADGVFKTSLYVKL